MRAVAGRRGSPGEFPRRFASARAARNARGIFEDMPEQFCQPHFERAAESVPVFRVVEGTPMCKDCYQGREIGARRPRPTSAEARRKKQIYYRQNRARYRKLGSRYRKLLYTKLDADA